LLFIIISGVFIYLHLSIYSIERSVLVGRFGIKGCLQNKRGADVGGAEREYNNKIAAATL
jgi:hypothetical protein